MVTYLGSEKNKMLQKYMGDPLYGPAWMFGDNPSVIRSSTILASVLKKGTMHCLTILSMLLLLLLYEVLSH